MNFFKSENVLSGTDRAAMAHLELVYFDGESSVAIQAFSLIQASTMPVVRLQIVPLKSYLGS